MTVYDNIIGMYPCWGDFHKLKKPPRPQPSPNPVPMYGVVAMYAAPID